MGADSSYVNQTLDHGGTCRDSGSVENPYKVVKEYGTNVMRVRLWHNFDWIWNEVHNDPKKPLYSGLNDVERSMHKAREQEISVNLVFHYSDIWTDPDIQQFPGAWKNISKLADLVRIACI